MFNETVKILKGHNNFHRMCRKYLIGEEGYIANYDYSSQLFEVKTKKGNGWFPATSLVPTSFSGKHFFRPGDKVSYNGKKYTVSNVRRTNNDLGQILLIDLDWIPSSQVKRL